MLYLLLHCHSDGGSRHYPKIYLNFRIADGKTIKRFSTLLNFLISKTDLFFVRVRAATTQSIVFDWLIIFCWLALCLRSELSSALRRPKNNRSRGCCDQVKFNFYNLKRKVLAEYMWCWNPPVTSDTGIYLIQRRVKGRDWNTTPKGYKGYSKPLGDYRFISLEFLSVSWRYKVIYFINSELWHLNWP